MHITISLHYLFLSSEPSQNQENIFPNPRIQTGWSVFNSEYSYIKKQNKVPFQMSYTSKIATRQYFQQVGGRGMASFCCVSVTSGSFAYLIVSEISVIKTDMSQECDVSRRSHISPSSGITKLSLPDSPTTYHQSSSFPRTDTGVINHIYPKKVFSLQSVSRREYTAYLTWRPASIWGMRKHDALCSYDPDQIPKIILSASEEI